MKSKTYEGTCGCEPDFVHRHGNGVEVDCVNMDHYARQCPNPPFSPLLAEALYKKVLGDTMRYGDPDAVSVTMLSGCPRKQWYERRNSFVEDPLERRWMLRGTFAHEGILGACIGPRFLIEQAIRISVGSGSLYGTFDAYDMELAHLHDLKTQMYWAIERKIKAKKSDIAKDIFVKDNILQVQIYGMMLKHKLGLIPMKSFLHYLNGDLRWVTVQVPKAEGYTFSEVLEGADKRITYLKGDDPTALPPREYGKFNPREASPVWYLIKETM